jgi:hypothetical protein
MSLSFDLYVVRQVCVGDFNITHNLGRMAVYAGVYDCLWRPDEHGITTAAQVIEPLKTGIAKMEADPDFYRQFDAENGWGTYDNFLPWCKGVLAACEANPDAEISVSR